MSELTTDDIALGIEIRGLYDGTAVWLLKDGTLVNRMAAMGWHSRAKAVDEWIAKFGDQIRRDNADLLTADGDEKAVE